MTTLPNYTPFYGGGQVSNPANVIATSGAPSSSILSENRVGTLAIDNAAGIQYILASKSGGVDTWDELATQSGAGSFTTLTNTLAYTFGTAQAANNSTIGSGQTSGTIAIGAAAGTGAISLGQSTAAQTINIESAASNTGAQVVNILSGATPGANTTLNIMGGAGTAGTQTFNVLASGATRAGAVNIGTGAAAHVLSFGSSSAGAVTVDTAAGISLDGATASNFTVTGASADLTLGATGGSINIVATEAASDAIVINASNAAGGVAITAGTGDINMNSIDVIQSLSSAGNDLTYQVTNSDNTNAASRAGIELAVGGTSSGDPYINFLVSGAGVYSMGIDNSASDNFVLSASTALGTSDIVTVTSAGALSSAAGITATTGDISASAGSVTAATTLTATLGNITATNGNLSLGTSGNKIVIATGANASAGTSGVMAGTPGVVTVATTACSATALVFYSRATTGGTPGEVSITAQDATGFTLTSTGNETSTFNWWIINA